MVCSLKFIREFMHELGNAVGRKILLNPLWFLGVTCFFAMLLYIAFLGRETNFTIEDIFAWGILYIILLGIGLGVKTSEVKKLDSEEEEKQKLSKII